MTRAGGAVQPGHDRGACRIRIHQPRTLLQAVRTAAMTASHPPFRKAAERDPFPQAHSR